MMVYLPAFTESMRFLKVMSAPTFTTDQTTIATFAATMEMHTDTIMAVYKSDKSANYYIHVVKQWLPETSGSLVMNNEKLGADPQKHAGGDAKKAIKFAWPKCGSRAGMPTLPDFPGVSRIRY